MPQFTFSPGLASKNASRTTGSQSIFFWKPFLKSRPFPKPEAGSRRSGSACAGGKQHCWMETLLGTHRTRGEKKCDFYPSSGSDCLPANPASQSAGSHRPQLQRHQLIPSQTRGNQSAGRGAQDAEPRTVQLGQKKNNNNNCGWRGWWCRRSRCCSARILRMLMKP